MSANSALHSTAAIDSVETTIKHRETIQAKRFLHEIYSEHYRFFLRERESTPPGVTLELGSGGGFIRDFIPDAVTSDVVALPGCSLVCSAEAFPFSNSTLSTILMINVFHHIQDVTLFFKESIRCLKPAGKIIMVEPAHTFLSRFIYRNFHHEPFEPQQVDWKLPPGGRLSSANDALPWIVFERDRNRFEQLFPALRITKLQHFMPFRYILSGGVSKPQLLPSWTYPAVQLCEKILTPLNSRIALFMKVVLQRT